MTSLLPPVNCQHLQIMNPDRRIVSRGHGPSDDSGSDDEENLRVSKCEFIEFVT